ncbi:hypothetical protein Phum_PHUM614450 [Pediculus humanus corporis]|uniref:Uncharacterized protein n=1 Tax=Pediculus humanus subsp. corporis TaxID=121224 RepID=E0W427_PEDHC|nr:uncharacterized protein Phum_PHUM614450 [Pediculus humanus corporis]EEB20383.1 hypothetical protein Phum_PHUM614450 [Pediculus humanus corporis]
MSEGKPVTSGNISDVESNREKVTTGGGVTDANVSTFLFSAVSTPSGPGGGGFPLRPIYPPKSALKGHRRSASHGGVATRPLTASESTDQEQNSYV